jgi:hypothetical protein
VLLLLLLLILLVACGVAVGRDLNEGTTRACRHLPGYTGFVPEAAVNEAAVQQAAGTTIRPDAKVGGLEGQHEYQYTMHSICS